MCGHLRLEACYVTVGLRRGSFQYQRTKLKMRCRRGGLATRMGWHQYGSSNIYHRSSTVSLTDLGSELRCDVPAKS